MSHNIYTGIIKAQNEVITFVGEGYQFVFVRVRNVDKKVVIETDSNGYIWGQTSDGKTIAIFSKRNLVIRDRSILNTWNFIVFRNDGMKSEKNNELFDSIRFYNGAIKSIYPCGSLEVDYENKRVLENADSNKSVYYVSKKRDVSHEIVVKVGEENITWFFNSMVQFKSSFDKGSSLENTTSYLEVRFEGEKSLRTLYDYYGYVSTLASFMTFRLNVDFEKVTLIKKMSDGYMDEIADCFVRTEEDITNRSLFHSISVFNITKKSFREMVCSVMQLNENYKNLQVDFLPRNDMDYAYISKDKIRHICSALEVEMDMAGIKATKGDELESLIAEIKKTVRKKRAEPNNGIPEKTYNSIFMDLRHWGDSAADRAIIAWKRHKDIIETLINFMNWTICDKEIEDDIVRFIRVRNDITHNGFKDMDSNLARTGIILSALVYCLALTRFKVDRETIMDFVRRRFIG